MNIDILFSKVSMHFIDVVLLHVPYVSTTILFTLLDWDN